LAIDWLQEADLARIAELVGRYSDMPLGVVDTSVIVVAGRLGTTTIATLDRRHFTVVRPNDAEHLDLLP
jgi:predicted nucleic acid-binding protein